jgi:protein-arginine kinase activator protein McsA
MSTTKTKTEHADIKFLKLRLQQLIYDEEYEKCATIHRWINELTKYHNDTIRHDKTNR